jgi:putative oxygen-independent coproporphyrinogen III oxidase
MNAFGIYVHWPYCVAKCPYCDFNSHVRERIDETHWTRLVETELVAMAHLRSDWPQVDSIFFGGGTPSLMSGRGASAVLATISRHWKISSDAEITLEANPNSVERERFREYRAAGVNRVSIGVQSFDEVALKFLGRAHSSEEAVRAIETAKVIFPRVNFDLIYARPGQTIAHWVGELNKALQFATEHLSLYQLTIEHGTAFAALHRQGKLNMPDEDLAADFYRATQDICEAAGLPAYEISNHARPGQESRHNLLYWRYGDYAGVGPGAHGRLTIEGRRYAAETERLPERWAARVESKGQGFSLSEVSTRDAATEHLLMGLRISEGVNLAEFATRWQLKPSEEHLRRLEEMDLIATTAGTLTVTDAGRLVLNRVIHNLTKSLVPVVASS